MTAGGKRIARAARLERQLRANLGKRKERARATEKRLLNEAPAQLDAESPSGGANAPDETALKTR